MSFDERVEAKCINTIRFLSVDMVQKANSGHPGAPMGLAPLAFILWRDHINFNPKDTKWINRDRFILSAGHASALLYSMLHLTGYDVSIEDLKNFRQYGSITPGHPEFGTTPGVEATTGPLGQGFANGVGMAIASKKLAVKYPDINHKIYAIVSDGDLMEGISAEAASIAGTLQLDNLVYIYDSNKISIEGSTDLSFQENVGKRFEAYGWHVINEINGEDTEKISEAITDAKENNKPSLLILKTEIGFGSPNKSGKESAHGEALGEDEVELTRKALNWNYEPFNVPKEVNEHFKEITGRKINYYKNWTSKNLTKITTDKLEQGWATKTLKALSLNEEKDFSTRDVSGMVLNKLSENNEWLIGGSADLAGSTKTYINNSSSFSSNNFDGINIHYGVREHSMGGINNGIALYSNFLPYAGTFLIFSDYMRPSIRLAALSRLQVFYIFTHDSIALGEDGPTHQPVSQLMSLRLIPNLYVFRPADYYETVVCYQSALKLTQSPSAFVLTRQTVPTIKNETLQDVEKGAYIVHQYGTDIEEDIDLILIGTGSELHLCLQAKEILSKTGLKVRVVSMPCWELFNEQTEEYKNKVLPQKVKNRISVEAGTTVGWQKYIGDHGFSVGLDEFGASAPGKIVLEKKGFSVENILSISKKLLRS